MDKLIVEGCHLLKGSVNISGSKNASLPILAASLLTDDPVRISRVPDVSDTNYMIQILSQLGASVERSSGTVRIDSPDGISSSASYEQVRKMRASICLLGPMMARMKRCTLPLPGGCVIGDRPVDLHVRAIQALGARVRVKSGNLVIEAPNGLVGATVDMRGDNGPTVLGTDNLMMAAVLARGTTVIGRPHRWGRLTHHYHPGRGTPPRLRTHRDPGSHRNRHLHGSRRAYQRRYHHQPNL